RATGRIALISAFPAHEICRSTQRLDAADFVAASDEREVVDPFTDNPDALRSGIFLDLLALPLHGGIELVVLARLVDAENHEQEESLVVAPHLDLTLSKVQDRLPSLGLRPVNLSAFRAGFLPAGW